MNPSRESPFERRHETVLLAGALRTPERLWLTKLATTGKKVKLSGESLDTGVVADFLRGLNASNYFVNVDLVKTGRGSTVGGVRLVQFEITADMVAM